MTGKVLIHRERKTFDATLPLSLPFTSTDAECFVRGGPTLMFVLLLLFFCFVFVFFGGWGGGDGCCCIFIVD